MNLLLEALIYALPIFIANSSATLTLSIPYYKDWSSPIDFGKSINGKRILGNGKTFRGLIFGTLCATLSGLTQYFFLNNFDYEYLDYNDKSLTFFLLSSFLLGFGALLGDLIKSFFKRRIGITRGKPWPPFDQLDFLTGAILLNLLIFVPDFKIILILYIITPLGHLLSNIIAYKLKLKNVWW